MLNRTFVHLPGVGQSTERKLWSQGIDTWEQLSIEAENIFSNSKRLREVMREIDQSLRALEKRDYFYFYRALPRRVLWRMALGHSDTRFAFLDIETTGLWNAEVTTITVLMDGKLYQAHERREKRKLVHRIRDEADVVVSYFGERFDVPFLENEYGFDLNVAQLDLCPLLRRHGHTGGLKGVETQFRGMPKRTSKEIDGSLAPVLWEMYREGNHKALETLLVYNAEDTVVLQPLLERALKYEANLLPDVRIPKIKFPALPKIRGRVSTSVMAELQSRVFDWAAIE